MMKFNKLYVLFLFSIIVLSSCTNECKHEEHNVNDSRPENAITYQEMASMFHQYDIGQKKVLDRFREGFTNDSSDAIESISHFYEISQLKQYIAYLEKLSKEKEIKLTGVRIFSAAYPKEHSDKKLRGRQTLIFMPTAKIGENASAAFEPLYSKKGQPINFTEFLNKFSSKETKQVVRASFLPLFNYQGLESSGANKLEPTPPM